MVGIRVDRRRVVVVGTVRRVSGRWFRMALGSLRCVRRRILGDPNEECVIVRRPLTGQDVNGMVLGQGSRHERGTHAEGQTGDDVGRILGVAGSRSVKGNDGIGTVFRLQGAFIEVKQVRVRRRIRGFRGRLGHRVGNLRHSGRHLGLAGNKEVFNEKVFDGRSDGFGHAFVAEVCPLSDGSGGIGSPILGVNDRALEPHGV